MVTAASAAAQKLIGYSALKAKQMDVVMGIVSERYVFTTLITRYGENLCYGHLPFSNFIFSITSSRYRVATAKTQRRFSIIIAIDVRTCIIMRIPPITFMQLLRSLEIPMAQVIDALVP